SKDPVAIDEASVFLFNKAPVSPLSVMEKHAGTEDKLRALRPKIDYTIILKHAEKIGLGSRKYELVEVN
ncbi:MAG: 4Fe-4S ferredoxin, partial [Deltaproteobacteria bacterium]|nr:4Fe-4S ferredoxin [Deltaproteobacteria bacterium]